MSTMAISVNDRLLLRDRPWIARQVTEVESGRRLLKLDALDGDRPASLEVVVPPEEPDLLPVEGLTLLAAPSTRCSPTTPFPAGSSTSCSPIRLTGRVGRATWDGVKRPRHDGYDIGAYEHKDGRKSSAHCTEVESVVGCM